MVAVNSVLIVNVVFMLLQRASYMQADCSVREYKRLPGGLNVTKRTTSVFPTNARVNIGECGQLCANEAFCKMWGFGEGKCNIFHSMKEDVNVTKSPNTKTETYYETEPDEKWSRIYFVKSGSGFNVSSSFFGKGDYTAWGPKNCTRDLCPNFFRSFLIDVWTDLPIKEVKLSLIKDNREVRYLIFDGEGTNSNNWFTMNRVLESPWKDVHKGAKYNHFTILIHSGYMRTFYMSKSHAGCDYDNGWIAVIEAKHGCVWQKPYDTYPQIIYSNGDSSTQWNKAHAHADALAVYISF